MYWRIYSLTPLTHSLALLTHSSLTPRYHATYSTTGDSKRRPGRSLVPAFRLSLPPFQILCSLQRPVPCLWPSIWLIDVRQRATHVGFFFFLFVCYCMCMRMYVYAYAYVYVYAYVCVVFMCMWGMCMCMCYLYVHISVYMIVSPPYVCEHVRVIFCVSACVALWFTSDL
jgi:hypothetical protein